MSLLGFLQGATGGWNDPLYSLHKAQEDEYRRKQQAAASSQEIFARMGQEPTNQRIDPSITPDMAARLRQRTQYNSAIAQLAAADPDTFGASAIDAMSPDKMLDYQQKQLIVDNMQAAMGGGSGALYALALGDPRYAPLYAAQQEATAKGQARQAVAARYGGAPAPQAPMVATPPMAAPPTNVRPDVAAMAGEVQRFGQTGTPVPTVTTPDIPASPEQMALGAQQMMQQPKQPLPVEVNVQASPPVPVQQAQPAATPAANTAQQQVTQERPLTQDEWLQTAEGAAARNYAIAIGKPDPVVEGYEKYLGAQKMLAELERGAGTQTDVQKMQAGRTKFSSLLKDMVDVYDGMSQRGTVPSAQDNWISRGVAALSQPVTDPQSLQEIEAYRQQLRLALIEASGLSSKVFDSNNEMQSLMKALTSPSQTIEATKNIIASLDGRYGTGELAKTLEGSEQGRPATFMWTPSGGLQRK